MLQNWIKLELAEDPAHEAEDDAGSAEGEGDRVAEEQQPHGHEEHDERQVLDDVVEHQPASRARAQLGRPQHQDELAEQEGEGAGQEQHVAEEQEALDDEAGGQAVGRVGALQLEERGGEEAPGEGQEHEAVGQGEEDGAHEVDPVADLAPQMAGEDVDAHVAVAHHAVADPEQEEDAGQVPFEFLQPGRAHSGQLIAELAGHHVEADHHRGDQKEELGDPADACERGVDRTAQREELVHGGLRGGEGSGRGP